MTIPTDVKEQLQKLGTARVAQRLSQELLASILGISQSTVAHWEAGRVCPKPQQQERIVAWLKEVEEKGPIPSLGKWGEARERCNQLKNVLNILEFHLRYFQNETPEAREAYSRELDVYDVGYLTSLMEMLFDEGKFQRWKVFTTHRFGGFRRKERGRKGKDKGESS